MRSAEITETDDGMFVLCITQNLKNREFEKYRSKNIEDVLEKLKSEFADNGRSNYLFRDYAPVLENIRWLVSKYPSADIEEFPADWSDPLELLGCLLPEMTGRDLKPDSERKTVAGMVFSKGAEWVWKNRWRLVAERLSFPIP
jgi:hypothetical protein